MPDWMKHKPESRLQKEISKPEVCRWHHTYGRKQRGTKESLDESERGELKKKKTGLKLNIQNKKIIASSPITSWQIVGETMETVRGFIFLGSKITADGDCSHDIQRHFLLEIKAMTKQDSILKSRDITDKSPSSQSYGFSSSHVWMWELDHKESWVLKNWCFWNVVLGKTLESPVDCKEIKPVNPKGDQSWIFIGRTDGEAETPILWSPNAKNWLTGKDPNAEKDWRKEENGMTEDEKGWMASLTQWTWVWPSSRSWWWRGKPGVLPFMR